MRRVLVSFSFALCYLVGGAQSVWQGMHLPNGPLRQKVVADTTTDRVYYFGMFANPLHVELWSWGEGGWEQRASLQGAPARDVFVYRDTVLMGIGGPGDYSGLQYWAPDGSTGEFGWLNETVYRLRLIEDTLYAAGYFTEVDGQAASGIAKRVDGRWVPVGTMPDPAPLMGDVIRYQGDLICVGQGHSENGGRCIYRLENGEWHVLAGGITDLLSSASGLAEYQGDLYISGYFSTGTGSAGCGVMRWNGSSYEDVGGGLLPEPNNYYNPTGVTSMVVHEGLLYCTGGFQYAGSDVPASGLAIWDGVRWCGVNGLLADHEENNGNYVDDVTFLGDTAFISCGPYVDGEEVGKAARAARSEIMGACDDTGLPELGRLGQFIGIAPDPATEFITLTGVPPAVRSIALHDAQGRCVATEPYRDGSVRVDRLAAGAYVLKALDAEGRALAWGRFVRE